MKICPYCTREAIIVTSPTTGCCNRAKLEWITKTYAKELVESSTFAGNAAALDNLHAMMTQFIEYTTDRDFLKQQVEACWNAIPFAITGSATLAEHVGDLGNTVRTVIKQRDHAMQMFELEKKIADILECYTGHDQTCSGDSMCSCGFKDMRAKIQPLEDALNLLVDNPPESINESIDIGWHKIEPGGALPPAFGEPLSEPDHEGVFGRQTEPVYVQLYNARKPKEPVVMGYLTHTELLDKKQFWSPRPWPLEYFTHWRHVTLPKV